VFLVCYSVVNPASYENIVQKWIPEIRHHCPGVPCLIVGTQTDLREDAATVQRLSQNRQRALTPQDGERLAQQAGAVKYVECSAMTQRGLKNVFDEAILAALEPPAPPKPKTKKKGGCQIL